MSMKELDHIRTAMGLNKKKKQFEINLRVNIEIIYREKKKKCKLLIQVANEETRVPQRAELLARP